MDGQRIRGSRRCSHRDDGTTRNGDDPFPGHKNHGRSAVADGGGIQQVDRIRHHSGAAVFLQGDGLLETGVRVVNRIGMGIDAEAGKIVLLPAVFENVPPHEKRVQRHEGNTLIRFPVGVRGGSQFRGDFTAG